MIAANGDSWTLNMFIDGEYQAEVAVDPQPAATLEEAKRIALKLEAELW